MLLQEFSQRRQQDVGARRTQADHGRLEPRGDRVEVGLGAQDVVAAPDHRHEIRSEVDRRVELRPDDVGEQAATDGQVGVGEVPVGELGQVAGEAEKVDTGAGTYLKWAPPSGEQLWLQVSNGGDAMGMNPHFAGKSAVRVGLETRVKRPTHTPLDGSDATTGRSNAAAT